MGERRRKSRRREYDGDDKDEDGLNNVWRNEKICSCNRDL